MSLPELAIRRPVFIIMLNAILLLFGWLSIDRIGIDQFPKIDIPILSITTTLAGANPTVIDSTITDPLEQALNSVSGIDTLFSQSFPSTSNIVLSLELNKNLDVAFNEAQAKINQAIHNLPKEAEPPVLTKLEVGQRPILWLVLYGNRTLEQLSQYASNYLRKRLQNITNVGDVNIGGEQSRTIRVELDLSKMAAYKITTQDIIFAFNQEHIKLPGGFVTENNKERLLDLDLEFHTPASLGNLIVAYRNKAPIRLNQMSTIIDSIADKRSAAFYNGQPVVGLGIIKISGTNSVAIIDTIKTKLKEEILPNLPKGIQLAIASDDSKVIKSIISSLNQHLILGALFAALVVLIFLQNFRATLIIAAAIPISLLGAIAAMYLVNYTFNTLTLLGLVLLIGVVVDDAIVVLENIYRHQTSLGAAPIPAAIQGAEEVLLAVLATTFTLVAIFAPVIYLGGVIGRFFTSFGVVVTVGVLVSLFVSLTLTPLLCSRLMTIEIITNPITLKLQHALNKLNESYKNILEWTLTHQKRVIIITLLILLSSVFFIAQLGQEFTSDIDEARFLIYFKTPIGSSLEYTEGRLAAIQKTLQEYPDISTTFATIGNPPNYRVTAGNIFVQLTDPSKRKLKQTQIITDLQDKLAKIPGVLAYPAKVPVVGTERSEPMNFVLTGPDFGQVTRLSQQLREKLRAEKDLGNFDLDLSVEQPQYQLNVDRVGTKNAGLSTAEIAQAISVLAGGYDVAKYNDLSGDNNRYKIRLKAAAGQFTNAADLKKVYLRSTNGNLIRLDSVATLTPTLGPETISRTNLQYSVNFQSTPTISLGDAINKLNQITANSLPPGYGTTLIGEAKEFRKTIGYIEFTLGLSFILVFMVLASQFNSFVQPLILMLSLPLAIVGGLAALWITRNSLNVYSMIGLVLLMGLVAKNSILLIDFTNQLRARGHTIDEALRIACPLRMRPVLMTSLTIILALLPATLGTGTAADTDRPLAIAVIGGLISSTLLTLIVVPTVYSLVENWREQRARKAQQF